MPDLTQRASTKPGAIRLRLTREHEASSCHRDIGFVRKLQMSEPRREMYGFRPMDLA